MQNLTARNPLGIIALFVSLIYGMAALLLGVSGDRFSGYDETILVLFIAAFPFIVLAVFGWLVACHHEKLYGPGDFRTDEAFHRAAGRTIGERLTEEIVAIDHASGEDADARPGSTLEADAGAGSADGADGGNQASTSLEAQGVIVHGDADPAHRHRMAIREAFLAETLAFQTLQKEFGAAVHRNVAAKTSTGLREVDGIIESDSGRIVVDVKLVRRQRNLADVIYSGQRVLAAGREAFTADRAMLVLIVDTKEAPAGTLEKVRALAERGPKDLDIRVYTLDFLMKVHGIPEA